MTYSLNNEVVRASAGSGKTFKLSNRYLELILCGVPAETILATTFTRAAAGEIQNRILSRLGEGASSPEKALSLFKALANDDPNFPQAAGIDADNALDAFQTKLAEIVRQLQRLRISTLDSFFIQLAGGYAFEMGLPANWHIVEEVENQRLLLGALLDSFTQVNSDNAVTLARSLFKGDYSRTIAYEIANIVNSNLGLYYDSERSPKSWIRLEKDLEKIQVVEKRELLDQIVVVKSSSDVQKRDDLFKAIENVEGLFENEDWSKFFDQTLIKNLNKGTFGRKQDNAIPEQALQVLKELRRFALYNYFKVSSECTRAMWGTLNALSAYFERAKTEKGAYRFDDLARSLREHSLTDRTNQLFYRLDSQTSHILLDEFQDASFTQWAVIRPFAESIVQRGRQGSFYCVGDVKQAIYGWRGGKAEIFDAISTDLPGVQNASLAVNWRSCPVVLDVVNELFNAEALRSNHAFELRDPNDETQTLLARAIAKAVQRWSNGFSKHLCAPKNQDLKGYWAIEQPPVVNFALYASDPALEPVPLDVPIEETSTIKLDPNSYDDDGDDEDNSESDGYSSTAKKMRDRMQRQATIQYIVERIATFRELYPNASIGVLARTNKFIAKLTTKLKERFKDQDVVISEEGGAPIVDSPAINAVLSVLKLAAHTNDSVAAFHLANIGPLSEKFKITLENYGDKYTPKKVSDAIRKQLESSGLGNFIAALRDLLSPICVNHLDKERLDKLVEFSYSYQATCQRFQLDSFIQAVREYKTESPAASAIRVMSLHKSKGLQFDVVVLPELEGWLDKTPDGLCQHYLDPKNPVKIDGVVDYVSPDKLANFEGEPWLEETVEEKYAGQVQEALNLLYVGITRPVRALYAIVVPDTSKDLGKKLTFSKILKFGLAHDRCAAVSEKPKGPEDLRAKILYEAGDRDWYNADEFAVKEIEKSVSQAPIARQEFREGMRPKRLLFHRATPTGGQNSREWFPDSGEAMLRGTALHKCFEAVRWLDVAVFPSNERLQELLFPILLDNKQVEKTIEEFKSICETDFIRRLLSSSSYTGETVVKKERQFSVAYDRKGAKAALVRGTIDRLVLTYENGQAVAADVIDYKSNQYEQGAEYEHYDEQLREYGKAVSVLYKLEPEKIKLRYVFVGKEWPDEERERLVEFN